jgi:hypothetical protein
MKEGHFHELMDNDDFKWELEYLISDMNAYAIHALKCLKAALIHYHPEKEKFFESWVKKTRLPGLLKLSQSGYVPENEDHLLLDALKSYRR